MMMSYCNGFLFFADFLLRSEIFILIVVGIIIIILFTAP